MAVAAVVLEHGAAQGGVQLPSQLHTAGGGTSHLPSTMAARLPLLPLLMPLPHCLSLLGCQQLQEAKTEQEDAGVGGHLSTSHVGETNKQHSIVVKPASNSPFYTLKTSASPV